MDVADAYVTFVRHSQDVLRDKVNEEMYIERLFDVSKCLLLLAAQGGEPPKCDKMRDRRISHILRKWISPDSKKNLSSPSALGSCLSCLFCTHSWCSCVCIPVCVICGRHTASGQAGTLCMELERQTP